MTYHVGDLVVIQSNITFSGEVVPLIGTSGTVSQEMINGQDIDGNATYRYDVLLAEPTLAASGSVTLTNLWLTQNEIDGVGSTVAVDTNATNTSWQTALIDSNSAATAINGILGNVKQETRYYENIQNLHTATVTINTELGSINYSSLDETTKKDSANTVSRDSDLLGFDSKVKQELAENLYGVYMAVDEVETDLKTRSAQEAQQEVLATLDNDLNLQAYQTTYIDNAESQNLLIPQSTPPPAFPEDDLSGVNPDMLLTGNTELEG